MDRLSLNYWKGKALASRVWVCSAGSKKFLYRVTDIRALYLLEQEICIVEEPVAARIWQLLLVRTPGPVVCPPHVPSLFDYQGHSTVYREKTSSDPKQWKGHQVFTHKTIDPRDAWAYRSMQVGV